MIQQGEKLPVLRRLSQGNVSALPVRTLKSPKLMAKGGIMLDGHFDPRVQKWCEIPGRCTATKRSMTGCGRLSTRAVAKRRESCRVRRLQPDFWLWHKVMLGQRDRNNGITQEPTPDTKVHFLSQKYSSYPLFIRWGLESISSCLVKLTQFFRKFQPQRMGPGSFAVRRGNGF